MSKKMSIIDTLGELKRGRDKKACGGVGILVHDDVKHIVTPHEAQRDIELIWVSVRRKGQKPTL